MVYIDWLRSALVGAQAIVESLGQDRDLRRVDLGRFETDVQQSDVQRAIQKPNYKNPVVHHAFGRWGSCGTLYCLDLTGRTNM